MVMKQTSSGMLTSSINHLATDTYKMNVVARIVDEEDQYNINAPASHPVPAVSATRSTRPLVIVQTGIDSATLAAIAVPIVVCVVAAFIYLCYRNNKLKAELAGVEMADVPRQQIIRAMGGAGFRRRAQQKISKPVKSRYSQLLGMGGGASEVEGKEISTNELGLDDDEDVEDMDLYGQEGGEGGGEGDDDQKTYTLDAVIEDMHREDEREDSLGFRS